MKFCLIAIANAILYISNSTDTKIVRPNRVSNEINGATRKPKTIPIENELNENMIVGCCEILFCENVSLLKFCFVETRKINWSICSSDFI